MKKTIFSNIFLGYIIITLFAILTIVFFSFSSIKNFYINSNFNDLEKNAKLLHDLVLSSITNHNLNKIVIENSKKTDMRITIIDKNGIVIADSSEIPSFEMENHLNRKEIISALNGKIGKDVRHSKTLNKDMLYLAIPIVKNKKILGVIRVSYFMDDIDLFLNKLKINIFYSFILSLLISSIIAWIFAKKISVPINTLKEASRSISSGNYNKKVLIDTNNELFELGYNFNCMAETIGNLFSELSNQKKELEVIISSVNAGIVVCDKNFNILMSNKIFDKDFLSSDNKNLFFENNKNIFEIIKNIDLLDIIKRIFKEKVGITEEVFINRKFYLLNVSYVDGKVVVIFNDITRLKEGEQIKKDFIQNVSHELKTPLSSIKAFVETLEDEKIYNQRYISIIENNTNRMINIVNDLLSLSEIENNNFKLEIEEIDIKEILSNIMKLFEKKATQKNINISLELDKSLDGNFILGDKFRLEQVFINLIDNAIKYTERGSIFVFSYLEEKYINVIVKDTGIGFSNEHKNRIFERFYVVDKSRSRKLGGTGLGLSIVKHTVLLHKGFIEVNSKVGEGSIFKVKLPVF
jgi:two-component system, OmpR family, phosphate regulon sensor histidine kinase PhoR